MKNRLRSIAWEHRLPLATAVFLQVAQSTVGMITIVLFQRVIDSLRAGIGVAVIGSVLGLYIGFTALNHLLIYAQGYPDRLFKVGTYLSAKRMAMRKLASIDYLEYSKMDTGTTLQVVENGATAGSAIISEFWVFIAILAPTLPLQLYLIQMYDLTVLLVVVGGYVVLFGVAQILMRISKSTMERVVSRKEELSKRIARGFMELVNLRLQRRFPEEIRQVDDLSKDVERSEGRIRLVNELFFSGFALLVFAVEVVVIVRQAALIASGESTVGTLVALAMFVRSIFSPVSGFTFSYVRYKMNKIPWRKLNEFLDLPDDSYLRKTEAIRRVPDGPLAMHSVSLSYDDRLILQDVSLTAKEGLLTSIVGTSGAGKSTVLRLLLGLLKPDQGTVTVGGVDLSDVSIENLFEAVTFVSQDSPIVDGTLRENLVGGGVVGGDEIQRALEITQLTALVDALEEGIDSQVGERGVRFSAGERQRIALARGLLSSARYVLLDEPTSALDAETEIVVMNDLLSAMSNRTVILVAHRLQPVRGSDAIVVLENGGVVESGSFTDLMNQRGRFRDLWEDQTRQ